MGRKSTYTPEIGQEICERLAQGEVLYKICQDKHMPSFPTVNRWLLDKPDFLNDYMRAREIQQDYEADKILEIADNAVDANLARVQIATRQWRAGRLYPKKYGEAITHKGDADNPLLGKTVEQLKAELELITAKRSQ